MQLARSEHLVAAPPRSDRWAVYASMFGPGESDEVVFVVVERVTVEVVDDLARK
jgi:hypothetical protein